MTAEVTNEMLAVILIPVDRRDKRNASRDFEGFETDFKGDFNGGDHKRGDHKPSVSQVGQRG